MQTLPDFLRPGLVLLAIGLNPSLPAVRAGYYFAGRTNRFWPALNASELPGCVLTPGPESCRYLCTRRGIGFTDVVKRPSRGGADLRMADFRRWVPDLAARIDRYQPQVLWFHGKVAYRHYLLCRGEPASSIGWGLQPGRQQGCLVYVSPNPSAANAVFRLADLITDYNRVHRISRFEDGTG